MATKIGCDHLVYAKMTGEDTPEKAPEYGEVTPAPGVMSVNITANSSTETLFADDGPMETATTLGQIDVEIQKNELTQQNKADLLGHQIDSTGGLVYGDSDVPPFVAIGFRTLKSNGKYRYVWLYKGKFAEPDDSNETKGDSINYQAATISGQFSKLNYAYKVNGKDVRPWKYEMDEDYETHDTATIAGWFSAVRMPAADTTGA
jgi:phi13 family phage major tail protein